MFGDYGVGVFLIVWNIVYVKEDPNETDVPSSLSIIICLFVIYLKDGAMVHLFSWNQAS